MNDRGVTLVELLVALVSSAVLIAGIYRTFLAQSHTFEVQEQVVETQQNVRVAINQMMREIRTAGSGNIRSLFGSGTNRTPITINNRDYYYSVNPNVPTAGALTILTAAYGKAAILRSVSLPRTIQVEGENLRDLFNLTDKKYISIGGVACYSIRNIGTVQGSANRLQLTLDQEITINFKVDGNTPVYPVRAITYQVVSEGGKTYLRKDVNLGEVPPSIQDSAVAENIENISFRYLDATGLETSDMDNVRTIEVTVTARTELPDSAVKKGEYYRTRTVTSSLSLRNMGI